MLIIFLSSADTTKTLLTSDLIDDEANLIETPCFLLLEIWHAIMESIVRDLKH